MKTLTLNYRLSSLIRNELAGAGIQCILTNRSTIFESISDIEYWLVRSMIDTPEPGELEIEVEPTVEIKLGA